MVSQLRDAGAVDKLDEVLAEVQRTRADLGFPPLVTPMSQMVGAQAVSNVLFGRYVAMSEPVKEYLRGGYGKPVSPVIDELVDKIAAEDGGTLDPPPERPGAMVEAELDAAVRAVSDLTSDIDDALIYALYPQTGERFLRIKHGLEPVPDEMKSEPPPRPAARPEAAASSSQAPPPMSARARRFNVYVGGQFFEVDVDPVGGAALATPAPTGASAPSQPAPSASAPQAPAQVGEGEVAVTAPMPGILVSLSVEEGATVKAGDALLVLEAMKMQNTIPSPADGTVTSLPAAPGTQVGRDDVLAVIQVQE